MDNYISRWNGTDALENSIIFDDGTNIGIGTTTPTSKLSVVGNISINAGGYLNFGTTDGTSGYGIKDNSGTVQAKNSGGGWVNIDAGQRAKYDRVVDASGGGTDTTIAAAITAASAGDTIFIAPGTYNENIILDKSLTIIGAGRNATTIAGAGTS